MPPALRRLALAVVAVLALVVTLAAPAAAVAVHRDTTANIVLAVPWATLLVSQIIPLLVALVAHVNASPAVKALTNVVLSALAAALTVLIDRGGSLPWFEFLSAFFVSVVGSQAAHRLLWSNGVEQAIASAVKGGIGAPPAPPPAVNPQPPVQG